MFDRGSITPSSSSGASIRPHPGLTGFRVWHHCLASVLVAVAIVNIQDQRRTEPALIGLAVAGFVLYASLGWGGWRIALRLRPRLGAVPLLALYLAAMAFLFLAAIVIYLTLEHMYLNGI